MKKRGLLAPAALGLALLVGQPAAAAQNVTTSPAHAAHLREFLAESVAEGAVPGIVALVVDRNGVVFEAAAGKQDVARNIEMPTDAVFRIASMTKPVTSVAAMMLVEQGQLALDDEVATYLPRWANARVITDFNAADGTYQTRPAARPITIRHLMTHTSGIGYGFSNPTLTRLLQGTQQTELDLPLLFDPGERWMYSASTRVLGQVIEQISGQPLDEYFRQHIFEPLGMDDTAYVVAPGNAARVATVHTRTPTGLTEAPNAAELRSAAFGDAGLFSTARDYGIFMRLLLNGGSLDKVTLLSQASVAAMGENHIGDVLVEEQPAATAITRPFPLGAGQDKFGLGFQIAADDERYAAFRSPGSLSWAGGPNTHFWIDPQRGLGAVVMMQIFPFYDEAAIATLRGFEERLYAAEP